LISGRKFKDVTEMDLAIDAILKDLPKEEELITKEESKIREENSDLRSNITLLESKVEDLNSRLMKAVKLGERIDRQRLDEAKKAEGRISELEALVSEKDSEVDRQKALAEEASKLVEEKELEIYKRDKVVGLSNSRGLIRDMEGYHSQAAVDELVEEKGLTTLMDPGLQGMRDTLGKGKTGKGMRIEEDSTKKKPNSGKRVAGHQMSELATLSGIHRN
jgi:hypothetical protein